MFKGIVYIIAACLLWGLIFVIPTFLNEFSAIEVALGRCLTFGMFSMGLFLLSKGQLLRRLSLDAWKVAFLLALVINVVHYSSIVLGLRFASAALTTLIIGINPVCLAIYGSFKQKNYPIKGLLIPCALLTIGLVMVNLPPFLWQNSPVSLNEYLLGILFGLIALGTWVWSAVINADFLQKNPQIKAGDWVTAMGVGTFFWSILCAAILTFFFIDTEHLDKYVQFSDVLHLFFACCLILGVCCSWIGSYFWNKASVRVPLALAGQLSIFETIFGLMFVYLVERRIPHYLEVLGVLAIFTGILANFYYHQEASQSETSLQPE